MKGGEMKGNEARVNKHSLNPYYNYSQFFGWNKYTHTYIMYVYVPREKNMVVRVLQVLTIKYVHVLNFRIILCLIYGRCGYYIKLRH